jgi:tRNA (cmo5U34)-methyltransferase
MDVSGAPPGVSGASPGASGAPPGATWRRPEIVGAFLDEREILIPQIEVQQDLVGRLLTRHGHPVGAFLDLGSGDGAMAELILGIEPAAQALLVDFSEPMLERAQRRLGRFQGRWRAIHGDLSDPGWHGGLDAGDYSAAVSSYAIHHLPGERKRTLFAELFGLLEPGAMFVNMDYVAIGGPLQGLFDEQMVANAIDAEHRHGGDRSDEQVQRELFDDGDDDRPDSVEDQLGWLREAGFEAAELHFKWAEAAVFAAVKHRARVTPSAQVTPRAREVTKTEGGE